MHVPLHRSFGYTNRQRDYRNRLRRFLTNTQNKLHMQKNKNEPSFQEMSFLSCKGQSLFSILEIILQVWPLGSCFRVMSSCNYVQDWLFSFVCFFGMCNLLVILNLNKPCIHVAWHVAVLRTGEWFSMATQVNTAKVDW